MHKARNMYFDLTNVAVSCFVASVLKTWYCGFFGDIALQSWRILENQWILKAYVF